MNMPQTGYSLIHQRGLSMVELMIAMLLGLILTGSVLQLFSSNKSTFNNIEGLAQIQDNARVGLERMKSRVRMAGYIGCRKLGAANRDPNNVTAGAGAITFNNDVLITGTNDMGVGNTDTVNIIAAGAADTPMTADMTAVNSDIILSANPSNLQENSLAIISDCENTDIFRISSISTAGSTFVLKHLMNNSDPAQVNVDDTLSKAYVAKHTRVMPMTNLTYSVEDTDPVRTDEAGNTIRALFETPAGGTKIEIMTGVEDMQITYGEDTGSDGEADVYRDADAVVSFANVVSVRIRMLIGTDHGIGPEPRSYLALDGTFSSDRRILRTFTATIGLRNRSS